MNDRKNGPRPTKPKIAPFRLATKTNIKDAPIFEDVDHRKKRRVVKLVTSLKRENNESTFPAHGSEEVKDAADQAHKHDINPFGKMFAGSIEKTPATSKKIFGDPYKNKAADPFDIMTAEPDEEEPAESLTVRPMSLTTETLSMTVETASMAVETDENKSTEIPEKQSTETPENDSLKSHEKDSPDTGTKESSETGNIEDVKEEMREEDILEINADIDSSTLKDTDDNNWEAEMAAKKEKAEDEKSNEKRHKKHKKSEKHEKGEKKKKRRRETHKSDEENNDKRHKKHRRGSHSRNRSRSRSSGSIKRRRDRSGNERSTFRDRSRERSLNQSHRSSNRRDSPDRFGSHQRSRSRSPIRRARSPPAVLLNRSASPKRRTNGKVQSPPRRRSSVGTSPTAKSPKEISPKEKFSTKKSLKEKSPREKSPVKKSPRESSPREKSPREKSPREKSPKRKTPREKSPRGKSPREKTSLTKHSKEKSSKEKSPKEKILGEKSPRTRPPSERSPRERSPTVLSKEAKSKSPEAKSPKEIRSKDKSPKPRRKSREEKSPRKNTGSQPSPHLARKKTDSEESASFVEITVEDSADEQCRMKDEVKESDMSMSSNVSESPSAKPQLKSYVQVVAKDPSPPIRIVPYLDDDDVMSLSPPRDSADGLNFQPEKESCNVEETDPVKTPKSKESKHRSSDESEPTKKLKVKRKSKKSQEKKRKKKALAKAQALANIERNTDDELEDLLFTKTNKELKEEEVFNDSDVFSAKHNLRTVVVDLDMKKLRTVDSPARKDTMERKLTPVIEEVSIDSPLPNEPEKLSEISEPEKDFPTSEQPPAQSGFSTIPFLNVDEEPQVIDEVEDLVVSDNAAYSPVEQAGEGDDVLYSPVEQPEGDDILYSPLEQPAEGDDILYSPVEQLVEGGNVPYSPVEQPLGGDNIPYSPDQEPVSDYGSPKRSSTMNLSDISTKDTVVEKTVGVITRAEKVEDFLGRIQSPEDNAVVDMDMSSPTNGMGPNSDDDIIEQLHKEFVRTQHTDDVTPRIYMDNHASHTSSISQSIPSPLHTAASDPIVQAYGFSKNYGTILKPKHTKRSKKKGKKLDQPLATEKKDIEDALNRVHRQARVEDEMKHALKVYFKRKDITKEEYKTILRKAVPQVANSNHGIDPERIRSLVKKYVAKYKGSRQRRTKPGSLEQQDIPFTFSP